MSILPIEAELIPLPMPETTPPVTKIYLVMMILSHFSDFPVSLDNKKIGPSYAAPIFCRLMRDAPAGKVFFFIIQKGRPPVKNGGGNARLFSTIFALSKTDFLLDTDAMRLLFFMISDLTRLLFFVISDAMRLLFSVISEIIKKSFFVISEMARLLFSVIADVA